MKLKIKKLSPYAKIPTKSFKLDVGFDLYANSVERTSKFSEYGTGIAVDIPEGFVGLIYPRSSLSKKDMILANHVGVIDPGYHGEVLLRFKILGQDTYEIGDRIGQLVVIPVPEVELVEVYDLGVSERGMNGFGSTGR